MAGTTAQLRLAKEVWALARRQHWVVARRQLMDLGMTRAAIEHRLTRGRLHSVRRGIYVVGRPDLTASGRWMAAVLSASTGAVLSHRSAGVFWMVLRREGSLVEVSVALPLGRTRTDLLIHRRVRGSYEVMQRDGIPVTTPAQTLLDLACVVSPGRLETAVNEADGRDLISVDRLRRWLRMRHGDRGAAALGSLLDRRTFSLTDSELERRFLPIARRAGLPKPATGRYVNGFKVDFYWAQLRLIVETDGLRYHRTPSQQSRDRLRDQTHAAAGFATLRFTHSQVRYEPRRVEATLTAVARRQRERLSN